MLGQRLRQWASIGWPAKVSVLTSAISLRAVSAPRLKSEPGTLLEIVAGKTVIGMQNSANLPLFSVNWRILLKACNKIINN